MFIPRVRSGDVFLLVDEEARIVRYLDAVAAQVVSASPPLTVDLDEAGMLLCSYAFAMRPVQIAKLKMRNVRVWREVSDDLPTVHLTFHMAKQKDPARRKLRIPAIVTGNSGIAAADSVLS